MLCFSFIWIAERIQDEEIWTPVTSLQEVQHKLGESYPEDDIILNNYENVIKEVKPGDPNDSKLYESIVETDPDDVMPPPPAPLPTTKQAFRSCQPAV